MNAVEIIKNIIPDGITQCKKSIWERLLLPDFKEPEPQDKITSFDTPEIWLDSELLTLVTGNRYLLMEYYVSSEIDEKEYDQLISLDRGTVYYRYNFSYSEYKERWQADYKKYRNIDKRRNAIKSLFEGNQFGKEEFEQFNSSEGTRRDFLEISRYAKLWTVSCQAGSDFFNKELYLCYQKLWEESKTDEGKINIDNYIEKWWCCTFHVESISYENSFQTRREIDQLKSNYLDIFNQLKTNYLFIHKEWDIRKTNQKREQKIRKDEIELLRTGYLMKDSSSIVDLMSKVLESSVYRFDFKTDTEIDFNVENKILIVDYTFPSIHIELPKSFDELVYSITLRSIYELFANDEINTIQAINFNGWVKSINKATGKMENTCIISIQVQRKEFMDIDLERVDPKTCFKHFKGIGSSKLYGITAIQPILQIQKNDKRFVDTHSVDFDDSTNLAIMAWEDFEHLIREIFEKEFSSNGGEVKVTQASRDGGVDAIAFDPDPIRGGKIVIQAKRYTNTVGVSAVRDLYGTVMNEGANKGILVTTSDYGSDSYEFAKGKPLTLLNGANLLYLLEKHGTRARIDIKEARRLMNEEK